MKFRFLFLLFFPMWLQAQQPVHEIISTEKGLPSKTVYDIFQDRQGFIWLAHEKGLSRYDGVQMKNYVFTTSHGRACTSLQQSADGRIWLVNFDGNVFYTYSNADTVFEETKLQTQGNWSKIYIINNELIKPVSDGLLKYDFKTNNIAKLKPEVALHGLNSSTRQGDEIIISSIISANAASVNWKYHNGKAEIIETNSTIKYVLIVGIQGLVLSSQKYWLFNSGNEIDLINCANGNTEATIAAAKDLLVNFYCIQNDVLWICTTAGLYAFDKNLKPLFNGIGLFPDYSISSVLNDREGILWLSSVNGGIIKVPSLTMLNYNFNGESITALSAAPAAKALFVGSNHNHIFNWNVNNRKSILLFDGNNNKEIYTSWYNPQLQELCFTSDKSYVLNTETKSVTILKNYVKDFYPIEKNLYAIATPGGFGFNINPASVDLKLNFETTKNNDFFSLQKTNERTRCVAFDSASKTYYAGTVSGLIKIDGKQTNEILFQNKPILAADLCFTTNQLFAATLNDGLMQIVNGKVVNAFNQSNGLLSNSILKLRSVDNSLWILSDKGLQYFDLATKYFTN